MTRHEIKFETKAMYEVIKNAQARLEEIRTICKHKHTHNENYSWRVGVNSLTTICSDCRKVIGLKQPLITLT